MSELPTRPTPRTSGALTLLGAAVCCLQLTAASALAESYAADGVASSSSVASTATASRHFLGAGLGLALTQLREDLVAPVRMAGPSLGLVLDYAYVTRPFDLRARLRWSFGVAFDRFDTTSFMVLPALGVTARVPVADTAWGPLRLGGAFVLREVLAYLEPWDDSHFYWLGTTGIGPSIELAPAVTPERTLAMELTLPVLAFVARPPRYRMTDSDDLVDFGYWHGRFADAPRLTSLQDFVSVLVRAEYRGRGDGFRLDPWLELELETAGFPQRMTHLALWLGTQARFGL